MRTEETNVIILINLIAGTIGAIAGYSRGGLKGMETGAAVGGALGLVATAVYVAVNVMRPPAIAGQRVA